MTYSDSQVKILIKLPIGSSIHDFPHVPSEQTPLHTQLKYDSIWPPCQMGSRLTYYGLQLPLTTH